MSHPMRAVTRRTGLTPDVLRAWEKRYQAIVPMRSEGGQRLYSDDDLERLTLLTRLTGLGRNISQVARLRTDELRALLVGDDSGKAPAEEEDRVATALLAAAMSLLEAFNGDELEKTLRRGTLLLGLGPTIDRVVLPMLHAIRDRGQRGEVSGALVRLAGSIAERTLGWARETRSQQPGAPHIVLATAEGEPDELGIQIIGAVAATLGWRVTYLGSGLSANSIVEATRHAGATVLALHFVSAHNVQRARTQIGDIRSALPSGVAIIAGAGTTHGDLAPLGLTVLSSQPALRAFLESYD